MIWGIEQIGSVHLFRVGTAVRSGCPLCRDEPWSPIATARMTVTRKTATKVFTSQLMTNADLGKEAAHYPSAQMDSDLITDHMITPMGTTSQVPEVVVARHVWGKAFGGPELFAAEAAYYLTLSVRELTRSNAGQMGRSDCRKNARLHLGPAGFSLPFLSSSYGLTRITFAISNSSL